MKRMLPAGVLPRNLTLRQTAEFGGVSYNTFRRLVRDGIAPPPMSVPGLGGVDTYRIHKTIAARVTTAW
jgi:hypothetical protein